MDWREGEEASGGKRALSAEGPGYERAIRDLSGRAAYLHDRFRLEREVINQAFRLQWAEDRAEARLREPAAALEQMFGLQMDAEQRAQLTGWLAQVEISQDAAGFPRGAGTSFEQAAAFVRERASRQLHDPQREVAQAAARQQGRAGNPVHQAVAEMALAAGNLLQGADAERWQKALQGLPEAGREDGAGMAATMAERLGVTLGEPARVKWAEILQKLPAWVRQAERSPAEALAARYGIALDEPDRAAWAGMLARVAVYRDQRIGQLRTDPELLAPLRAAVLARCPDEGMPRLDAEITYHAYRQQQAGRAGLAGLEPVEALARWANQALTPQVQLELNRLLPQVAVDRDVQGRLWGSGPAYERALDLLAPGLEGARRGRVGEELARQAERTQLWEMEPADALSRTLGITWSDARERAAAVNMLRGIELNRTGEGPPRGQGAAFEQAVETMRERSGAGRQRVEGALSLQAARQQSRDRTGRARVGRQGFKSMHRTLSAEARRAEAASELGRMRDAARAEARARSERMAQMGVEEERSR